MPRYRLTIEPLTGFATPLKGDTLFGQLCWRLRHQHGNNALNAYLEGYTTGQPFLVVSDAMPHGYWPRPTLPAHLMGFDMSRADERKAAKRLVWMPEAATGQPLSQWHNALLATAATGATRRTQEQSHNTLNRLTGATGTGAFAPYSRTLEQFAAGTQLDIYAVIDTRLSADTLAAVMEQCGQIGFGKEASTGLGKFRLVDCVALPSPSLSTHWLTLGPSVPASSDYDAVRCFYSVTTRFGKHGDAAVLSGQPFKNPVVMAQTGALLTLHAPVALDIAGIGLGGQGELSRALPETVHQGYAPVVPIVTDGDVYQEVA